MAHAAVYRRTALLSAPLCTGASLRCAPAGSLGGYIVASEVADRALVRGSPCEYLRMVIDKALGSLFRKFRQLSCVPAHS